jgi:hypothetical protein
LAAAPIKGGRYAGKTSTKGYVAFNVGDNGRAFVSNPRLVLQGSEIDAPCGLRDEVGLRPWDLGGSRRSDLFDDQTTVGSGRPVRVRADGRFGLVEKAASAGARSELSVKGRFASDGLRALGSFRVRATGSGARACARRGTFVARFTGQRHFTRGDCPPAGVKLRAANGSAVVYHERYVYDPVVRNNDAPGAAPPYGPGSVEYGCVLGGRRQWFLAGNDSSSGLFDYYLCGENFQHVVLAHELAGLALFEVCQPGVAGGEVRIVDLRTGKVRFFVNDVSVGRNFPRSRQNLVYGLVLAPSGSAAWLMCTADHAEPRVCQVVEEAAYWPLIVLDQGQLIKARSLALHGSTLSWLSDGEKKTARLT